MTTPKLASKISSTIKNTAHCIRALHQNKKIRIACAAIGLVTSSMLVMQHADANIMRGPEWNQHHIDAGTQYTIASRAAQGLGGGIVSMEMTATNTSYRSRWSGVAIKRYANGSGWILSSFHPVGDFYSYGYGEESYTVGTAANFLTSGETRLPVSQVLPLFGSGSRDPTRPDIALYFVEGGLPQFNPMPLISIDQVPVGTNLDFVGYGQWGYNNQIFPRSGDARRFIAPLERDVFYIYDPADYRQGYTSNSNNNPLLGRGIFGYSGGFVGTQAGMLGVMSYTLNGYSFSGFTGFTYLTASRIAEINSIILPRKTISSDNISAFSGPIIPDCIAGPGQPC